MRKVVHVTAVAAAGLVLLACNRPPERQAVAYALRPRLDLTATPLCTCGHAARSAAADLWWRPLWTSGCPATGSASMPTTAPPMDERTSRHRYRRLILRRASNGRADVSAAGPTARGKSSPRWATVKGEANAPAVKRVSQTKFNQAPKRRRPKSALKTLRERTSPA